MMRAMAYREDLDAAHQRIAALERELASRDEHQAERERALRDQITGLEARIEALCAGPSRLRQFVSRWLAALVTVAGYGVAFALVAQDHDAAAWAATSATVFAAVILPVLMAMTRAVRLGPWLLGLAVKAAVLVQWGWGWWTLAYEQLPRGGIGSPDYNFFWYAPPVFLLLVVIERVLIAFHDQAE